MIDYLPPGTPWCAWSRVNYAKNPEGIQEKRDNAQDILTQVAVGNQLQKKSQRWSVHGQLLC